MSPQEQGRSYNKREPVAAHADSTMPGVREYMWVFVASFVFLLLAVGLSAYFIITAIGIGAYGHSQVARGYHVLVIIWLLLSAAMAGLAIKISLMISHRVTGPIRRIERALDTAIREGSAIITLREKDALLPLAEKINQLIKMQEKRK